MFRLLRRLVGVLYHDRLLATWHKGYDAGLTRGYEISWQLAQEKLGKLAFLLER